jgi:cytoskeletal protein RodZ
VRATRAPSPRVQAKRPSLRVLDARQPRRGRLLRFVAASLVVGSLLSVVVGHSILAQGQVRLTSAQTQMSSEQAIHRQLLAAVAEAENPAQIIAEAKKLNLVTPSSITQLPAVPLTTPVGQATTTPTTAPTSNASSTAAAGPSATAGR